MDRTENEIKKIIKRKRENSKLDGREMLIPTNNAHIPSKIIIHRSLPPAPDTLEQRLRHHLRCHFLHWRSNTAAANCFCCCCCCSSVFLAASRSGSQPRGSHGCVVLDELNHLPRTSYIISLLSAADRLFGFLPPKSLPLMTICRIGSHLSPSLSVLPCDEVL